MVLAAVWPEESFAASWQLLWENLVAHLPGACGPGPGSGSVAKARHRVPLAVWQGVCEGVAQRASALSAALNTWRGHRLVLLDGTCVSMGAEAALFTAFGTNTSGARQGRYPLARLVTARENGDRHHFVRLKWYLSPLSRAYALGRYDDGELALSRSLLRQLPPGALLIADRLFAAAHLYALYLSHGLQFLTRMHSCLKPERLRRVCTYTRADFVVELPLGSKYRQRFPELPALVQVRLIQVTAPTREGREVLWLATSLLSAQDYPAAEIAALYARRWRMEELFRDFKINLSADVLRSKTPDGIRKEIAARVTALNVVRLIMLEAALQEGVDPLRIGFAHAIRTILAFSPLLAIAPLASLPRLYRSMLRRIAGHLVRARPGRQEPRMIRRERIHYPTLKTTRAQWRLAHGSAA
jgi:hypothetical protein